MLKVGYAALATAMPLVVPMSPRQRLAFAKRVAMGKTDDNWGKRLVGNMLALWYQACDEVVAVSEKSANQLRQIASENDCSISLSVVPTGVNPPYTPTDAEINEFCRNFNIDRDADNVIYFGRLGQEKNLAMLIQVIERVVERNPKANLIFGGDWEYRATLEKLALDSPARDHIIFTGRYNHEDVGLLTAVSKVYLFPSLTDTQGLAVTEAAYGGLPIVLCDPLAPACFIDGQNGYVAKNDPADFADKIVQILSNEELYKKFSAKSRELAADLTERKQTKKLVELYRKALRK